MNKSEIVEEVKAEFERRFLELKEQTLALQHDVANESKSSAGDKHETARAMMNLEQEKLEKQFHELMLMKERFEKINFESPVDKIQLGSLIETNKGFFLLSVGLGKVKTNKQDLMLLSLQSPLGEVLFGKRDGDFVMLNKHEYNIIKVI